MKIGSHGEFFLALSRENSPELSAAIEVYLKDHYEELRAYKFPENKEPVSRQVNDFSNPLHAAVAATNMSIVEYILQNDVISPEYLNVRDGEGMTPTDIAILYANNKSETSTEFKM